MLAGGSSVTNDRNRRYVRPTRRTLDAKASRVLPATADQSHGFDNLASQPRSGNISTDTRAGIAG